jgi:hypothetical protein
MMAVFSTTDMKMLKAALETIESEPKPSGLKHCKGCFYDGWCPLDICDKIELDFPSNRLDRKFEKPNENS